MHPSLLKILNSCLEPPHISTASASRSCMSSGLVGFVQNCNVFSRLNILPFQRCLMVSFSLPSTGCFLSRTVAVMELTKSRSNGLMS